MPYSTRRTFLETSLTAAAALAASPTIAAEVAPPFSPSLRESGDFPLAAAPPKPSFPVADYHVHLSEHLSIDQAVALGKERGIQIGILEHPGPGYPINTDT